MGLRTIIKPVVDLSDRRFAEGLPEDRQRAEDEAAEEIRRYQAFELAVKSGLPEVQLDKLRFARFGEIENSEGEFFRLIRGQVDNPKLTAAVAWLVDARGEIRWLERPASGPRNRAEAEAQRAEREARRSRKSRPAWMK